tara:strand:+ start:477 stop:743 length:267 start_codon:yes stop_codon:yes gene_type:complete
MKKIILLLAVISFAFSCESNESNEWNAKNKKKFMDECNADGTMEAFCDCYLNQLVENDIKVSDWYSEGDNIPEDQIFTMQDACIEYHP